MNKVTVLAGITVLAIMAGCAKKEAPQAQVQAPAQAQAQDDDEDVGSTATQVQPAAPQPESQDRTRAAAGMIASIDPGPQCQVFRDELEAKGKTPGPVKELSAIFVQAYEAGCGRKKQQ